MSSCVSREQIFENLDFKTLPLGMPYGLGKNTH